MWWKGVILRVGRSGLRSPAVSLSSAVSPKEPASLPKLQPPHVQSETPSPVPPTAWITIKTQGDNGHKSLLGQRKCHDESQPSHLAVGPLHLRVSPLQSRDSDSCLRHLTRSEKQEREPTKWSVSAEEQSCARARTRSPLDGFQGHYCSTGSKYPQVPNSHSDQTGMAKGT